MYTNCSLNVGTLKALYISDNKLVKLPPEIGRLTELETLVVRDNKITTLPEEIGKLTKLKALYAQGNKLVFLPVGLANCKLLIQTHGLKLAGNPLHKVVVEQLQLGIP